MPPISPDEQARLDKTERELHRFRKEVEKDLMDWRAHISQSILDVQTDTRVRLARAETERDNFYKDSRIQFSELGRKMDRAISLAESTNGKVTKHETAIYGPSGTGGLCGDVKSLLDARLYVTVLVGFLATTIGIVWMIYGPEIKERGILNRTIAESVQLIDSRVHKWFPAQPAPADSPNAVGP